ncbi:hypothetical protein N0V88_000215 [Collariella sp. IMI 366227]|nr:hypothetical protein N0V88_000215 [Collariella sp. IMI 366227]
MGDVDNEPKPDAQAAAPTQADATATAEPAAEPTREETLEQARKFLHDAEVQNTTPERKAEFLKNKGLSDTDIEGLLKEVSHDGRAEKEDRPPIVTYPEFLTKPAKPPPLVTVNRFLNTLYAFAGVSTIVYGASKYVVEPMVNTLTEARITLHDTANQDLTKLVTKLESTVSELPAPKPTTAKAASVADGGDDDANFSTGTSAYKPPPPPPPSVTSSSPAVATTLETPATVHASQLGRLVTSVKGLSEGLVDTTESLGDVQSVLDLLRQDLDKLSSAHSTDFVGGYSLYGVAGKNEPDDEIRKAKENIRRVKRDGMPEGMDGG